MKRLGMSVRIGLLVGACLAAAGLATAFLVTQVGRVAGAYEEMLAASGTARAQQDRARLVQVEFKTQVQEWKNILLRGSQPEMLTKYRDAFHKASETVGGEARGIAADATSDEVRALAVQFVAAHDAMNAAYAEALAAFEASAGVDYAGADAMVSGKDRPVTSVSEAEAHAKPWRRAA